MISQENKIFYAFNIDKMFKAVFAGNNEASKRLLLELLSECLDTKIDRIVEFIPIELGVRSKHERSKRLDLIVEVDGRKINVELNSSFDEVTRIRNLNYYFSFCSQYTIAGDAYDFESEFIHISLNYRASNNSPLIACYTFYDKEHKRELDKRFKYYEINVEKFAKFWYDKDMKSVREKPLLTMIGIKDPDELDKYSEKMDISSIKESVDKLKTLNSDKKFVYNITPEQDDLLTKNTLIKIYKAEGLAEGEAKGKAEGLAEGKAKGKAEGLAEAQREITINLLKKNIPIKTIVEVTGLSEEEIKNIDKSL
mgnify:CR=1 FL=1